MTYYIMEAVEGEDDKVIAITEERENAMKITVALNVRECTEKLNYCFTNIPPRFPTKVMN